MSVHGAVIVAMLSALVISYVVSLTVRQELSERWCLLWIVTLVVAIGLVVVPGTLMGVTRLVGAVYPASALTLVSLFFLLVLAIHASSEATVHARRITILTQELALLKREIEQVTSEEDA